MTGSCASVWQKLLLVTGIAVCLLGAGGKPGLAHPASIASALAKVRADGSYEVRLRFDLLAYSLNELPNHISDAPMNALLDGPQANLESRLTEAKQQFRQNFRVNGSVPDDASLSFPTAGDVLESAKAGDQMRLPVMATVTVIGRVPLGTKTIAFQFDEVLGSVVLTTELPYEEPVSEPVEAGTVSTSLAIPTAESVAQAAAALRAPDPVKPVMSHAVAASEKKATPAPKILAKLPPPMGPVASLRTAPASPTPTPTPTPQTKVLVKAVVATSSTPFPTPSPHTALPSVPVTYAAKNPAPRPASVLPPILRYVKMGYTHILPEGLDHILFVLGLFLLSTRIKVLIKQVTAFTLAHSLTLALSLYGVIHLPSRIVEPIIAASIVFVAVENLVTTEIKASRLAIVFGFGLIHGLGFAEALHSLRLPQADLLPALVGFNVGVELGQLSVVLAAYLLVLRVRNHPNYRKYVIVPGSVTIAVVAVFWFCQRVLQF